jgi:hypothetical protein
LKLTTLQALQAKEREARARIKEAMGQESVDLADHLPQVLERTEEIVAHEELANALVSGCAHVSVAYVGPNGYLSIGLLLQLWQEDRFTGVCTDCGEVVYYYGAGGSPLSGSGSMWGLCGSCRKPAKHSFNYRQVSGIAESAQFHLFQDRVQEGDFIGLGELLRRLNGRQGEEELG